MTLTDLRQQLTDTDRQVALRQHLTRHRIGADERWDAQALQALHEMAHEG